MAINEDLRALVARLEVEGTPFEAISNAPWIIELESRLQWRFPSLYRQLYTSYLFPEFDIGGVTVFANLNSDHPEDITNALFADAFMSAWLIEHGYLQFARPDTGSYDSVCFDFSTAREDPNVVRLDHEDILQGRCRVRSRPVADSFAALDGNRHSAEFHATASRFAPKRFASLRSKVTNSAPTQVAS